MSTAVGKMDWRVLNDRYMKLLRPLQNPVAMKFLKDESEINQFDGVQVFDHVAPVCQALGRCGYQEMTIGVTTKNFHINGCRIINGLYAKDDKWESGKLLSAGWYDGVIPGKARNEAMLCMPSVYKAIVVSSMGLGAIDDPDCIYMKLTPSAAFMLLQSYIHKEYEVLDFKFRGEGGCSDSYVTTLVEGKIGLALGGRGERAFGQMNEFELIITMKPEHLTRALDNMEILETRGLPFPFASEALFADVIKNTPEPLLAY